MIVSQAARGANIVFTRPNGLKKFHCGASRLLSKDSPISIFNWAISSFGTYATRVEIEYGIVVIMFCWRNELSFSVHFPLSHSYSGHNTKAETI